MLSSTCLKNALHNARQKLGMGESEAGDLVRAMQQMQDQGYAYCRIDFVPDEHPPRLCRVFFMTVEQIELARLFGEVLIMDATYKTNRHATADCCVW